MLERLETLIAGVLVASRWLMAPLYIGLIAVLVVVVVAFFHELLSTVIALPQLHADAVILAVLKLIDLVLLGNLVLIMIFAGVCTLGGVLTITGRAGWTQFMGKIDFSGLKLKVVASLIAIAAVDLLESFVEISTTDKSDVLWQIAILMAFVVSGVLLAWMDRLVQEPHDEAPGS
jgi:uncharacterized protein (TIGR00645 family)